MTPEDYEKLRDATATARRAVGELEMVIANTKPTQRQPFSETAARLLRANMPNRPNMPLARTLVLEYLDHYIGDQHRIPPTHIQRAVSDPVIVCAGDLRIVLEYVDWALSAPAVPDGFRPHSPTSVAAGLLAKQLEEETT